MMTRLGAVFWLVLVLAAGFTTFKVKYAVQDIEDELNRVRRQTIAEQQEIRVLTAEWTYLNQPERLAELNRRFLGLGAITARQLQHGIGEIPLRPPAAPTALLVEAGPDLAVPGVAATPFPVTAAPPGPAPGDSVAARQTGAANSPQEVPEGEVSRPPEVAATVQLAKAGPTQTANSLDALIAQIVETR